MKQDTSRQSAEQSEVGLTLEALIRRGARDLIQKAIEVEVQELLSEYANVTMLSGQRAVVRNGYLPARDVLTAVGNVQVQVPSRPCKIHLTPTEFSPRGEAKPNANAVSRSRKAYPALTTPSRRKVKPPHPQFQAQ